MVHRCSISSASDSMSSHRSRAAWIKVESGNWGSLVGLNGSDSNPSVEQELAGLTPGASEAAGSAEIEALAQDQPKHFEPGQDAMGQRSGMFGFSSLPPVIAHGNLDHSTVGSEHLDHHLG